MVYNNQQIFSAETHGVTAMTRPWIIAMALTGTGSVLVEQEVGSMSNVWAQVAPAYVVASPHHVIAVEKGRNRIRVTPANGATYNVSNQ